MDNSSAVSSCAGGCVRQHYFLDNIILVLFRDSRFKPKNVAKQLLTTVAVAAPRRNFEQVKRRTMTGRTSRMCAQDSAVDYCNRNTHLIPLAIAAVYLSSSRRYCAYQRRQLGPEPGAAVCVQSSVF